MSTYGGSYSNISSVLRTPTILEQLIEEINFQRAKEMRQLIKDGEFLNKLHFHWENIKIVRFMLEVKIKIGFADLECNV